MGARVMVSTKDVSYIAHTAYDNRIGAEGFTWYLWETARLRRVAGDGDLSPFAGSSDDKLCVPPQTGFEQAAFVAMAPTSFINGLQIVGEAYQGAIAESTFLRSGGLIDTPVTRSLSGAVNDANRTQTSFIGTRIERNGSIYRMGIEDLREEAEMSGSPHPQRDDFRGPCADIMFIGGGSLGGSSVAGSSQFISRVEFATAGPSPSTAMSHPEQELEIQAVATGSASADATNQRRPSHSHQEVAGLMFSKN